MNAIDNKWIGKRTIRPDGADKVTGRAGYSADHTMPGMIWGKVLRSPHPHAVIRGIDTAKAEALPGVKAVVTAQALAGTGVVLVKAAVAPGASRATVNTGVLGAGWLAVTRTLVRVMLPVLRTVPL